MRSYPIYIPRRYVVFVALVEVGAVLFLMAVCAATLAMGLHLF